jgi:dihydroxyacetone kinase-like predicted kinase
VSIPAGLAALVAYDGARGAAENATEMIEAAAGVAAGEVTRASRDVQLNGLTIRRGDWLGLADGDPVAGGEDFADVALGVVARLLADGLEASSVEATAPGRETSRRGRGGPRTLLTLLTGADPPPLDGLLERLGSAHPALEIEVHEGGQPYYPLLLGAE